VTARTIALLSVLPFVAIPTPGAGQTVPIGRERIESLTFPPLRFDPPKPTLHEVAGDVSVLYLEDSTLPVVDVVLRFKGGYERFPRESYAAATALPALIRNGGSKRLPPDSVDALFDLYALQTTFGGGGGSSSATLSVLRDRLEVGLDLWGELIREPGFDAEEVEIWRGRELENARRRADDPGTLAYSTYNRIMYGNHPIGWELGPEDLEPGDLEREHLERLHRQLYCRGNMVVGVTGDVTWDALEPLLQDMLENWPECSEPLSPPPIPEIRTEAGVLLIPRELNQSIVVMAHASDLRWDDEDYFASRIGNAILGASGFASRLMSRVRTEEGYAYAASSLWTAPRNGPGLVGAVTRTRSERTVAAARLLLDVIGGMGRAEPEADEVRRTVQDFANGYVFNFQSPAQIVARQTLYRLIGLPEDWLGRYLEEIQDVSPADVQRVFQTHVHPERMVILILGDPDAFDEPLEVLGPVTVIE
jgi:zinc protease